VTDPQWQAVTEETKALIEGLLQERLLLRAICRMTGVSLTWLQNYLNDLYAVNRSKRPFCQRSASDA